MLQRAVLSFLPHYILQLKLHFEFRFSYQTNGYLEDFFCLNYQWYIHFLKIALAERVPLLNGASVCRGHNCNAHTLPDGAAPAKNKNTLLASQLDELRKSYVWLCSG